MEKGASASALSSTSGDEIVGKGGSRDPINSPKRTTFRVTCIRDLATRCYMLPAAIQSSYTTFMGYCQVASPCVVLNAWLIGEILLNWANGEYFRL